MSWRPGCTTHEEQGRNSQAEESAPLAEHGCRILRTEPWGEIWARGCDRTAAAINHIIEHGPHTVTPSRLTPRNFVLPWRYRSPAPESPSQQGQITEAHHSKFPEGGPTLANIRENSHKERRGLFAALLVLFLAAAPPAVAAKMTADKVNDKESLKALVIDAKRHIESLTDYNDVMALRETLREQPRWAAGDVFLIMMSPDGSVGLHAGDRAFQGRNILDMHDDRGVKVVRQMMEAGEDGGGFVDYVDGVLKTSYTVKLTTGAGDITVSLIGGYSKDLSSAPAAAIEIPTPAVTAADVVDKDTLVAFVEAAAAVYRRAYASDNQGDIIAVRNAFRDEGGPWRAGPIYLWIVASEGITILHTTERFREGKPTDMDRVDVNGLPFPKLLIGGALREGRKFLRYYYDNPTITGDEDTGSPKFGYAVSFNARKSEQKIVVGSGIYLEGAVQQQ